MSAFRATFQGMVGRMRLWQLTLSATLLSTALVAGMSLAIQGRVTWDTVLTAAVAALVAAWLIRHLPDVDARRRAQARLERYEFMVNAVGDMMSVINREHRYEAVNDRWCVAMARRCDAVLGVHLAEVWGEADYRDHIVPRLRQCFDQGQTVALQTTLDLPGQGSSECAITYYPYRAAAAGGEVSHVVVVTRDVSGEVRAARALQASEARLRALLDSMVDGVIVIDQLGTVTAFNPAAQRMFGYTPDEVLGRNVSLLMPEPDHSAHDGYLQRHLDTGVAHITGAGREVTGRRKDGSTFPLELAVSAMTGEGGRSFVGVVRDIGARKAAERRLADALEAARKASRAKSEFLSSMSHELRTPMNAILGFAQLLEMDARLGDEQRDNVVEILKAGRHLLALINEVLDLSRIESGRVALRIEPVPLADLIGECAALVGPGAIRQGLTFRRDLAGCAGRRVRADRLRIKQVLLNLLSNAVKYNRRGGEVRITCGLVAPGRVRLTVSDTGLGIPEDQQAGLFTAFHRLGREDSDIEGTGIGLAISKKLVERMDGDIGVESRVGQGSTFWVDLPDADGGAEPACAPAEVMQEAPCATPAAPDCTPADPSVRR